MSIKLEQVLQLEPQNELLFRGPFTEANTACMKLTNPTDKRVMFKIKTTAPKKYCVRPNSGILDPKEKKEIEICLQPCMYDATEKNKHKFMVQSAFAPSGELNMEKIWKEIIPEHLMDSKLRCSFEISSNQSEIEDSRNLSPAASSTPVTKPSEISLKRAKLEMDQLKEEESYLKEENARLRNEILQLKEQVRVVFPAQAVIMNPLIYMALSIILAALGIAFVKFLL
ncbi:vesicle-associated membrane protein-associated protein B/C [Leptinotarsa decemlineata]|uniref:vesicle-associated membrane protein-associated protein B/C n=1 Tax=Leptinotarsa decemlineata TaxID=7539 RepID=UPI000C253E05|nr:vesicle-associated membrane protein-associated protein B-like [Leptinotarsa decemlineata]